MADRFDFTAPLVPVAEMGRVHVTNVAGAGMSAVARVLLDRGVDVSGSDPKDLPVLEVLRGLGADVRVGTDPAVVDAADTVVVSSATRETDPELSRARELGRRVLHRSQALASAAADRRVAAVAGANGKTTTSSMLTALLVDAGADPSFAVGGELAGLGVNARAAGGEAFVIEADESDGSFVVYRPEVGIVTNVQPDHLDHYGTFEAVQDAYLEFARTIRPGGLLVACLDDAGSARLAERARAEGIRVVTYGTDERADVRILGHEAVGFGTHARVRDLDGAEVEIDVVIPGGHNVLNATAAYTAAVHGLGTDPARAAAGLGAYRGTRRRFEIKGAVDGITVVDDYAHNPGKVAAVVGTAADLTRDSRLVVCFQPHLYSRTRDFADRFAAALGQADVLVLLDVYGAREDPMPGVTSELISDVVRRDSPACEVHDVVGLEAAAEALAQVARPGDLVLTVGAGSVTSVGDDVLGRLERRSEGRG